MSSYVTLRSKEGSVSSLITRTIGVACGVAASSSVGSALTRSEERGGALR